AMGLHELVKGSALILISVAVGKLEGETSAPDALHLGQLLFNGLFLLVFRSVGRGKKQHHHADRQDSYPHKTSFKAPNDEVQERGRLKDRMPRKAVLLAPSAATAGSMAILSATGLWSA